jgi:hypothetical protein
VYRRIFTGGWFSGGKSWNGPKPLSGGAPVAGTSAVTAQFSGKNIDATAKDAR